MRSGVFNNATARVLMLLVTALLLTTIGSQIYRYINDRRDTQEAVLFNVNEDIDFEGIIIRDEQTVSYSGGDVISYMYPDGSKVTEGAVIAKVYDTQQAALNEIRAERIEEQIESLRRAQNPGTTDYVQPETISRNIDDSYKQLLACAAEGNFESYNSVKSDMTLMMNIYNIISGISTGYDDKIAELQKELLELQAQSDNVRDTITAAQTGYFVSHCDGLESALSKEGALTMTEADIEDVISRVQQGSQSAASSAVGKTFSDYTCYIAGVIDSDSRVAEDAVLQLKLDSSETVYDVEVVSVKPAQTSGRSVVVLSCDSLDSALVSKRVQSMQLIFDEYQGIKVPRSAIRFQGEQKGVYVILGEDITFKKIDVIYEGSDFVLSANTSDEDSLLLYDQILLEVVSEGDVQRNDESLSDGASVSGDA